MGILRVLGRETAEREQYEESCRKHTSSLLKLAQWRNCMDPLYGALSGLPFSVGLTAGTLAALMDLVMRIFWPVEALSHQIFTLQQAVAGLRRISSYFHECVEERHYSEAMPHDTLPVERAARIVGLHDDIMLLPNGYISHRISGIIDADEVHILNGGHLVESGDTDALMKQEGWYAMMLRLEEMDWENASL